MGEANRIREVTRRFLARKLEAVDDPIIGAVIKDYLTTRLEIKMPSKQIEDHYEFHRNRDAVTKPEGSPEVGRGEKPPASPVVGDLSFSAQDRIIERVKRLIRNDVKVNLMWSHLRMMVENNADSGEAAMMILSLLASDPVESENLINAIREPHDRIYQRSY